MEAVAAPAPETASVGQTANARRAPASVATQFLKNVHA